MEKKRYKVLVCRGPECGGKRNSGLITEAFRTELERRGLTGDVELGRQSCFGRCSQGPNCLVREITEERGGGRFLFATLSKPGERKNSALYNGVDPASVAKIVDEHIAQGRVVRSMIRPVERKPAAVPANESCEERRPTNDNARETKLIDN